MAEHKWTMIVDLDKCTGCQACVVACHAENNVPIASEDEVVRGRGLHWIRIERYWEGEFPDVKAKFLPVFCQQCGEAPCEPVCPTYASYHSPEENLNVQVYNRCVGTRYCGNNCPYKVRRFNYFNYRDHFANGFFQLDSITLMNNPEVTVRSRGVMEKCTFCIQRISEAKQEATKHNRPLKGSDVKTACQIACPSDAIIFGDMNDPESDVSQYRKHNLGYHVLELLNIIPNITYIAKLRNKHTEDNSAHGLHS